MAPPEARIPVRNVYALLAYAWDFLDLAAPRGGGETDADTPPEGIDASYEPGAGHQLPERSLPPVELR